MDRRLIIHGLCVAAALLAVAFMSTSLATRRSTDILAGLTVIASGALASTALLMAHRARQQSRAGAEVVAALARWMSLTQQQLAAVRDCGRSIEMAIVELDAQIEGLLASQPAAPGRHAAQSRAVILGLPGAGASPSARAQA